MVLVGMVLGMAGNAMGYGDDVGHARAADDPAVDIEEPEAPVIAPEIPELEREPVPLVPKQKPKEPEGPCPPGMAHAGKFCVDKYEAHLVVTDDEGERVHPHYLRPEKGVRYEARSEPGFFPQGYINYHESKRACENAGKRLCTWSEWRRACQGPRWLRYPYGQKRKDGACNSNKAHLLSQFYGDNRGLWTHENFNDPRLNQEPGYLALTGAYEECVSEFGAYDMVGNLHEWVSNELSRALLKTLRDEPVKRMRQPYRLGNGLFLGGFYSTLGQHGGGCFFVTYAHEKRYHDYSTGFRCCADAQGEDDENG
jgi:formylglycine-generating enzyme required for sulfatase activity